MKQQKDLRVAYILFGILILLDLSALIFYGITIYAATRPIEVGGTVECNSGYIGIDYESYFNTSESTTQFGSGEYSFNITDREGWTPKILNIKGINNLNCKVEFNSKLQISDLIVWAKANGY